MVELELWAIRKNRLSSDEAFGESVLGATLHPAQPRQAAKGVGVEPVLRSLAAKVFEEQLDLAT